MTAPLRGTSDTTRDALAAWSSLLGQSYVSVDPAQLAAAESATFETDRTIPAILRPGSRSEVRECLAIANEFRVPVYPVSAGKNWGYGSQVPTADASVLLLLDRLNRISGYDEKLAYVTVEPGVTFRQLHDYLTAHDSRLLVNSPGSTADASVVGNVLERGVVQGPDADRFNHVGAMEVILANGDTIRTGFDRFGGSLASPVSRVGPGPSVESLFFQSNLGVVTEMAVWLKRVAPHTRSFTLRLDDAERLPSLIDILQDARMDGLLGSSCTLLNACRVMTYLRQFPFDEADPARGLHGKRVREFADAELAGGSWFGSGSLEAASAAELTDRMVDLRARLIAVVDEIQFASEGESDSFQNGTSETGLAAAYWRKRTPIPANPDPDRDRCGIIWCTPVAPFEGSAVARCIDLIESTMRTAGFESGISIQCASTRAVHIPVAVLYDRDEPGDDRRAEVAARDVLRALADGGFLPYRVPHNLLDALPPAVDSSTTLLASLRRAVDPNGILAPGRYEFGNGGLGEAR